MTRLQDEIEAQGLWDLDSKVDQAMDAPALPLGRCGRVQALGRRAAPRGALRLLLEQPELLLLDEPPTIWTRRPPRGSKAICGPIRARS